MNQRIQEIKARLEKHKACRRIDDEDYIDEPNYSDLTFLLSRLEAAERVVEAAKEMRDLLHLRLRYCPEALWLEENYIKLKDALAALERGGSNGQN